jgi:hypothetical protein
MISAGSLLIQAGSEMADLGRVFKVELQAKLI